MTNTRRTYHKPTLPTPIVALDVDGPLNAYARPLKQLKLDAKEQGGYRPVSFRDRISYRPGSTWHPYSRLDLAGWHGDALAWTSRESDVELVWASLWEHNCNTVIGPALGLPRLRWVDFHGHPRRDLWKFPAMIDFAAGRPLCWLDDSFNSPRKIRARELSGWDRARRNLPTLLLHVDPSTGIEDHHLDEVESWVRTARLAW
ncbi:MAG: hypothetical protein WC054_00060 [Candidatus Nanopelagicales bacterium]